MINVNKNLSKKVAIIGYHMLTPLGETEQTWNSILRKQNAVYIDKKSKVATAKIKVSKNFNSYKKYLENKYKFLDTITYLTLYSVNQALHKCNFNKDETNVGVVVGSMNCTQQTKEKIIISQIVENIRPTPRLGLQQINNSPSAYVAIENNFHGPNLTVSTACSSSAQAICTATDWIKIGRCNTAIVAGVEILPSKNGMFQVYKGMRVFSIKEYNGPFSILRNGFAVSEGVGCLVLENYERAQKEGHKILGIIEGTSLTEDGVNMATPEKNGKWIGQAMINSIKDAGLIPNNIDYVNAHATATKIGDTAEALAIQRIWGINTIPAISIKGNIGHTFGASGIIASIISTISMKKGIIPPTCTNKIDKRLSLNVITKESYKEIHHVLVNAFGFGGNNVSIILGNPNKNRVEED